MLYHSTAIESQVFLLVDVQTGTRYDEWEA